MNNKGFISNSFTYEGKVDFKLQKNGKLYSIQTDNEGTKYLLDVISKALSGQDISKDIPKYIDFICIDNNGEELSLINHLVPITGAVWGALACENTEIDINSNGCLLLSGNIEATNKISISENDYNNEFQLCLCSATKNKLAIIQNESLKNLYLSLTEGTDAIIEWRMVFTNKIKE